MNITIANMDRRATDGFVTAIHWTANKSDGTNTASSYGTVALTPPETLPDTFVPYADLTQDQALGWLVDVDATSIEDNLDKMLVEMSNPPIVSGTPWTMIAAEQPVAV